MQDTTQGHHAGRIRLTLGGGADSLNAPGVTWSVRVRRLMADTLTPVLAYRRLVRGDARLSPSFLFESVVGGEQIGRYSFLGARPIAEVLAYGHQMELHEHTAGTPIQKVCCEDPLRELARLTRGLRGAVMPGLPAFTGGWVGFAGYDTVRYVEPEKLKHPPADDRGLPDLHFQLYRELVIFDHVQKTVLVVTHVASGADGETDDLKEQERQEREEREEREAKARLDAVVELLSQPIDDESQRLPAGHVDLAVPAPDLGLSTMDADAAGGPGGYGRAVERCKQYIAAGDAFQIVPSQRFEVKTRVDPFAVYRCFGW